MNDHCDACPFAACPGCNFQPTHCAAPKRCHGGIGSKCQCGADVLAELTQEDA